MVFGTWYLNVTDIRKAALAAYLKSIYGESSLEALNGDASLRRYFRTPYGIAVDAPPTSQKNAEFVAIDKALLKAAINVPEIYHYDLKNGFMVLEDLGDRSFFSALNEKTIKDLYLKACDILPKLTQVDLPLPKFDSAFIDMELGIFTEWMLDKKLNLKLSDKEQKYLDESFKYIKDVCLSSEQIPMHRDFHCRNLMLQDDSLYVIDFQDMVEGPLTYDLASLVFDCYLNLSESLIEELLSHAFDNYKKIGFLKNTSFSEFKDTLKIVSLERHLKVLGIFRRLYMRDGKSAYLKDLPRVFAYAKKESASDYRLSFLHDFLNKYLGDTDLCKL